MTATLRANLDRVRRRIAAAAAVASAGARSSTEVELVAVTKSVTAEVAADLVRSGVRSLGENRVQELERKAFALAELGLAPRWHLIGHLQTNKARRAIVLADVIHSLDSLKLADLLDRLAGELGRRPEVYLEVKLIDLEGRSGFAPSAVAGAVAHLRSLSHLKLVGLMTLAAAPSTARTGAENSAAARATFRSLAALAKSLPSEAFDGGRARLSMGMSQDFVEAVGEGADCVRVGSALYEGLDAATPGPETP